MTPIHFDVLTLFPEMFEGFLQSSLIKKAHDQQLIETRLINFRDYATDKHRTVDDAPYGGGDGMVLKPDPLFRTVDHILTHTTNHPEIILMSPQGEPFTQQKAKELSSCCHLVLLCGHYAGFDERVREHLVTQEISIGDYVLTGGELPAMVVMDSVSRYIPGVLGNAISASADSFSDGLIEHPQYTRPAVYRGHRVPDVLLSGHHERIEQWRRAQSLKRTLDRRPELLKSAPLSAEDQQVIDRLKLRNKTDG